MNTLDSDRDEVASMSTIETLDEPPPAYEDLSPQASISTEYTNITLNAEVQPIPSRPFPLAFNLYSKKTNWKSITCHIGEHAETPCNAIVLTSGWKGTTLTLTQTADPKSPALAFATAESPWSRHSTITVPSPPGSDEEDIVEQLHFSAALTSIRFSFDIRIPVPGDKPCVEKFEWRITHGTEVQDLHKRAWGWKLVRVNKDSGSVKQGGKRGERSVGETSDGKEIVAVWADNFKAARSKFGRFQFVGSGATGELGRAWAIMAVMTILRVFQNMRLGSTGGHAAACVASSSKLGSMGETVP